MMTRLLWDTIFLICGSLYTFGAGPSSSTIEAHISIDANSTTTSNASIRSSVASGGVDAHEVKNSHLTFGEGETKSSLIGAGFPIHAASNSSTNISATVGTTAGTTASTTASTTPTTTTSSHAVKKFVAAAVRSHFDDCPDSHHHFCFHGTCRFLVLEDTPTCICHPGFMGMRCEHADLLAVVATNHRQQTVATVLVLCVIGCVLIVVLCTLLHCWWQHDCRRRRYALRFVQEKHGVSCYPPESVV